VHRTEKYQGDRRAMSFTLRKRTPALQLFLR